MVTPLSAVVIRLADAIGAAQSLDDVYAAALVGLRTVTGIDRASILLFDDDGVMRFKAWSGLSEAYRSAVEGHTPWSPGDPPPQPVIVPDVRNDPTLASYAVTFTREDIRALAFIPVVSRRRVIGKFMLYRTAPDAFDRGEVDAALAIGYQIGFAVERMRSEQSATAARQRMVFALDAAQMGTWEWDIAANTVQWSENLERLHGLPPGTFNGTFASYENEIHPDDRLRVMASLTSAIESGAIHDVEYRIVAPDGRIQWVQGKGRVERDVHGRSMRMTGVCMDVSGRKQSEEDVQRALAHEAALRERLGLLTDGAQRLLVSLTPEQVVGEVLELAASIIRADAYAVWRRYDHHWKVAASRGLSDAFVSVVLPDEPQVPFVMPVIADDVLATPMLEERHDAYRREAIVSLVSIPLAIRGEPGGSIVYYYRAPHRVSVMDLQVATALAQLAAAAISNADLHRMQGRLRQEAEDAHQEARNANRLKDEFLATLSHELRTPLNVIAGRTRRLVDVAAHPDAVKQNAETIGRNADALTRLVEDLLDVSRFTLGQVALDVRLVEIDAIVQNVIAGLEPMARAKRIALGTNVHGHIPALTCDQTRMQQVVWNLVTNAIKFTPEGGRVEVSVCPAGAFVELAVSDTGIGIAPAFLPHVFDMFRQGERSGNRTYGGLGLGLSIVRRLVELHGGTVSVVSPGEGAGATFTVRLPCAESASSSVAYASVVQKGNVARTDVN